MIKTLSSGCKINWFLKVTGRRPNGYHDIVTLFQYLPSPSDTIELDLDAAPGIKAACDRADLPQDMKNLAGQAAQAYADAAGIAPCWNIFIRKAVPSAAGLGGGSADAGAVLRLLETHYGVLGREKLIETAASIGADVPFFLEPGLVLAEGIGEKMTPFPAPEKLPPMLIVFPGFPVSARWAYCNMAQERISAPPADAVENMLSALRENDPEKLAGLMHNDLEYALFDKFPLLEVLRSRLTASGALKVMVSGSGSSLIALFDKTENRKHAASAIRGLLDGDFTSAVFELGEK